MRLGRYVLEAPLGLGASGEVWRATLEGDLGFRREVALKLIRAGRQSEADLAREAHLGAALRHPHIATVLELFVADGFTVMAMELVDGPDLQQVFDAHPDGLDEQVVAAIVAGLADGCKFAHELRDADGHALSVVHRDLKPSNALIDHTGVLKIVDFGIARSRAMSRDTAPGMLRGTPYYLAPELLHGQEATPASDVWAIGAIAYEALLGHPLVPTGSLVEIATSIATLDHDDIAAAVAERSERLAPIVTACLLRDPSMRPSARAIVAALGDSDGRPVLARLVGADSASTRSATLTMDMVVPPPAEAPSRMGWIVACLGVALVAILASGVWRDTPPVGGGVLRIADPRGRGVFEPYNPAHTLGRYAFDLVVDTATRMGAHGQPEPGVVASWESDRDWMTWTLHVRPDAIFHAHPCLIHGERPADAGDLLYSLRVAIDAGALDLPLANGDPDHALTADGDAVRLRLDLPYPFLAERLARLYVLPRELDHCEDLHAMRQPVGTGPFRFDKPPIGETLQLVRSARWWGREGGPKLDGVTLVTIPESSQVLAALREGSIDAAVLPSVDGVVDDTTPPKLLARLPTDRSFLAYDGGREFTLKGLYVFPGRPDPVLDVRLRRAISATLDRAAVTRVATNVRYTPTTRFLDPSFLGYDPSVPPSVLTPGEVRALVAQVGRKSELTIGSFPGDRPLVDVWIAQLREIGLDARAVRLSTESLQQARTKAPCDLALIQITERVWGVDPLPFLLSFVDDLVRQGTASDAVHALITQAAAEPDRDRRAQVYAALMAQLREELPFIPVGIVGPPYRGDTWIVSDAVHGFAVPQAGTVRDEVWTHFGDVELK